MAIFERSSETKIRIDDTDKLECILENAQNINKHTEYILRVQRGPNKDNRSSVSRRYRDFAALNSNLQQANIDLPFPPKKLIGNMQPSFIAERQIALQNYINEVLRHQILALSLPVRSFLDPHNYPSSIAERALQTVSIALRGDGQYELISPLPDVGWRIRKHYFLVNESKSGSKCLLSYQCYGPDYSLNVKDLQIAFKSLQNMSHPYIADILRTQTMESGAYVVRRIYENGSIRDILYKSDYNKNYLFKYGNPEARRPFSNGQICRYGYQILQALKFLNDKGLPHGHIHTGNITIDKQTALLLDIENCLLGVPSVNRPWILELKRPGAMEAMDVYSFGRVVYEMAFATPLDKHTCDIYQDELSSDLESVLELCMSSCRSKEKMTSLDTLLHHQFFTRASLSDAVSSYGPRLKIPLNTKEAIRTAVRVVEERIRSDHRMVRSTRREVRIQEILNSEEEMKKQKKRAKKLSSEWKSSSSLAEASRSVSAASDHTPNDTSANSSYQESSPTGNTSNTTTGNTSNTTTGNTSNTTTGNTTNGSTDVANPRGALLSDICSFNRNTLSHVSQ